MQKRKGTTEKKTQLLSSRFRTSAKRLKFESYTMGSLSLRAGRLHVARAPPTRRPRGYAAKSCASGPGVALRPDRTRTSHPPCTHVDVLGSRDYVPTNSNLHCPGTEAVPKITAPQEAVNLLGKTESEFIDSCLLGWLCICSYLVYYLSVCR